MTTTTWTTSGDVPPASWAALVSDMGPLLAVLTAHATVTGPSGAGAPLLSDQQIGFQVTAHTQEPVAITFQRAAGTSSVTTSGDVYDGLVLAALDRAGRWFGSLLSVQTDAGTAGKAMAEVIIEGIYGAGDRAITGQPPLSVPSRAALVVAGAQARAEASLSGGAGGSGSAPLYAHLQAVIAELTAVAQGYADAGVLLSGTP